ncbi:MAG: hypothetical protein JO005_12350 [Gammaproteobacteria bacterium]|nr:hypothetical protein [Gammaproteobacteria bacterium]
MRILLNGRAPPWRTWAAVVFRLLAAVAPACLAPAAGAATSEWRDVESRIQYAFYTEDARTLERLAAGLAAEEAQPGLRDYYVALAAWRQAQLRPAQDGAGAAQLAGQCVQSLDAFLSAQADSAEGLALRAACAAVPLAGGGLHAPFALHRPRRDLERALQLAGRNPRVLLIDASLDEELAAGQGGNRERALTKLRRAVNAFEAERADTEPLPGWGAAEAYLYLARSLLAHSDALGARDALERALLLAPQYAQARRLLAQLTA